MNQQLEFTKNTIKTPCREVDSLELEPLQLLRETYKLYDYLKNNANKLQIIAEVKKPVLVLVTLISKLILSSNPKLTKIAVL